MVLKEVLIKNNLSFYLKKGLFGIEKENIRVSKDGSLALTPHPISLGDKGSNPYITTDFSESQVEMITPPLSSPLEAINFLKNLHDIVTLNLEEEYLWPQSSPPSLPGDIESVPIASFTSEDTMEKTKYRNYLATKYGKYKQLLSGIHYNFSFTQEFLEGFYEVLKKEGKKGTIDGISIDGDFLEFKNSIYLKLSRNFLKHRWFLIFLLGGNPSFHSSYQDTCQSCSQFFENVAPNSYSYPKGNSFRNGLCGYRNKEFYYISHENLDYYLEDLDKLIQKRELYDEKEYYSPIRLKPKDPKNSFKSFKEFGINYLEVRLLDLNPLAKVGIEVEEGYLLHSFLLFCLFDEDNSYSEKEAKIYSINHELAAHYGRDEDLELFNPLNEKTQPLKILAKNLLEGMEKLLKDFNLYEGYYKKGIISSFEKIQDYSYLTASKVANGIKEKGFIPFNLELAKNFTEMSFKDQFKLAGYDNLELSTKILIKESLKNGIEVEILDPNENFIALKKDNRTEYVIQATKTSLDTYSTVLLMENKLVTKIVLDKANLKVPKGKSYNNIADAMEGFYYFSNQKIVVKPNTTNFGKGITILPKNFDLNQFKEAVNLAFSEDSTILIEEFIEGKEYRFLVIDNKVVGILNRVPANVKGNGIDTITQLVQKKNQDPLRGEGYKTPLEKIKLGEMERFHLETQGYSFETIPNKDEIVYLRENSNISTGGDSIDYTDLIPHSYKEVAIRAAKAADAKICGIDIIIKDITLPATRETYGIIEINFNPAIHIHCYPFKGKDRKVGEVILKALKFL